MAKAVSKKASKKKADTKTDDAPPPADETEEAPPAAADVAAAPETVPSDPPSGACQNCGFNLNLVEGKDQEKTANCPNCGFDPQTHEQLVKQHHG